MRIGAGLSTDPDPTAATAEAAHRAWAGLGDIEPSLAVLVASRYHGPAAESVAQGLHVEARPQHVVGCVAETVVGGDLEVEDHPAVAVWLASLPEPVETFHMEYVRTSEAGVFGGYRFEDGGVGAHLMIADPYSFPADVLLGHLNEHVPGTTVMGGMASGATAPGETRLLIDEYITDPERGDFLVRGVLGLDPQTGALAVGEAIEVGQTIQFHVRDAETADEDLRTLLDGASGTAAGALLFTCNGRGTRMFSAPNHDAALVSERLGGAPLAGFNCAGEIGPVGGKNFLHGV